MFVRHFSHSTSNKREGKCTKMSVIAMIFASSPSSGGGASSSSSRSWRLLMGGASSSSSRWRLLMPQVYQDDLSISHGQWKGVRMPQQWGGMVTSHVLSASEEGTSHMPLVRPVRAQGHPLRSRQCFPSPEILAP